MSRAETPFCKRLTILRDASRPTRRPVIYCPTHIGGVDIEMSFVAVRLPCWLMLGDPRELYKKFSGFMLQLSGLIPWIPWSNPTDWRPGRR